MEKFIEGVELSVLQEIIKDNENLTAHKLQGELIRRKVEHIGRMKASRILDQLKEFGFIK